MKTRGASPLTRVKVGAYVPRMTTADLILDHMAGTSARALAAVTGLSRSTVERILRGDRDVKVAELTLIATALGVIPADLIPASAA